MTCPTICWALLMPAAKASTSLPICGNGCKRYLVAALTESPIPAAAVTKANSGSHVDHRPFIHPLRTSCCTTTTIEAPLPGDPGRGDPQFQLNNNRQN